RRARTGKTAAAAGQVTMAGRPVTLKQAEALAHAQAPQLAMQKAALAVTPASPATVGKERRKLEEKVREENKRRIEEYNRTLAIMTERGVKGLSPPPGTAAATAAAGGQPLRIFAEGD